MICSWKKLSPYKRILISWVVIAIVFFAIGLTTGLLCSQYDHKTAEVVTPTVYTPSPVPTVCTPSPVPTPEKPQYISLGEFKVTAYCPCEKCCGIWGKNRPLDEYGNEIIITANQSIAQQGVTVAADTSVLPFGTVVLIGGQEYIVQDRGKAVKGNHIDVYFDSHEDALEFGVQYKEVFIRG